MIDLVLKQGSLQTSCLMHFMPKYDMNTFKDYTNLYKYLKSNTDWALLLVDQKTD